MKIDDIPQPGLFALGVLGLAGLAATALAGFAVGVAVSRDPDGLRRTVRGVARNAARGLEQATLLAAQTREHLGDLWAEAREDALAEVDAADFARAAAASGAAGAASAVDPGPTARAPETATADERDAARPRARSRARKRAASPKGNVGGAAGSEQTSS